MPLAGLALLTISTRRPWRWKHTRRKFPPHHCALLGPCKTQFLFSIKKSAIVPVDLELHSDAETSMGQLGAGPQIQKMIRV